MDRRVKERLIGASILVALVVLVVPELLSGPKPSPKPPAALLPAATPEPNRTVTVELGPSKPSANPDAEPAAAPPAAAIAPSLGDAASSQSPANTVAPPSPAAPHAAPHAVPAPVPPSAAATRNAPARKAAVESPASSPMSAARGWSVQLGSFASRANADNMSRQVKGQGFAVFVAPGGSGAHLRYRVRVGPLADRNSAERMAAKLKTLGHISSLVGPAG
jgi:DedD protein